MLRAVASQNTVEPATKLAPVRFMTKPAELTGALTGVTVARTGGAMVKRSVLEAGWPGAATATFTAPGDASRGLGTTTTSCVGLLIVVWTGLPFQVAEAPETKPLPVMVTVAAAAPAGAEAGDRDVIEGDALVIANETALDFCPAAVTLRVAAPGDAMRLAGTVAVI